MSIVSYTSTTPVPYTPSYNRYYPVQYFSGVDVSLFITPEGDTVDPVFIDEVLNLQFGLKEFTMPVYTYASYTPSTIVHGSRLVEGTFTINLRPGDYMHELVNSINNDYTNNATTISTLNRPDPNVDLDGYQAWSSQQRGAYWNNVADIIAQGTSSDFSLSPYFTQNNFTIVLIYGDVDSIDLSRNIGRVRTIENVHLCGVQQQMDLSGTNIQETFSFQAYDINQQNRQNKLNPSSSNNFPSGDW